MSRRCIVSNKGPMSGNNVSHANNKTKRRYLPNMQSVSLYSDALGKSFRFRLAARAIKTIDSRGGLDNWLNSAKASILPSEFKKIKKLISKKVTV